MKPSTLLEAAVVNGGLRELDRHFADRMARLGNTMDSGFALAAALVSQQVGEGHVCADLSQWAGKSLFATASWPGVDAPELDNWLAILTANPLVGSSATTPLVLEGSRLYLGRYWAYEQALAEALLQRAGVPLDTTANGEITALLGQLFPRQSGTDWQAVAAALAVVRPLTVISGGPGTGKTHTVAAILAMLCSPVLNPLRQPRIALAAPTGKAAVRLVESIHKAREGLREHGGFADIVDRIPEQAATLHRLLGVRPGRVTPNFNANNPLHLDVLVVDEASMISLPLMAKLVAALPTGARLILLGDKDQLASVEAGSVFADLCAGGALPEYSGPQRAYLNSVLGDDSGQESGTATGAVADSLVLLRRSYRFAGDSGIAALAQAINRGDGAGATGVLESGFADIDWQNPPAEHLEQALRRRALQGFAHALAASGPEAALRAMAGFRILCALRVGPTGVESVNQQIEQALRGQGMITGGVLYQGRPVMVTENAPGLNLFNGDMGVLWPDPETGAMRAWFADSESGIRSVSPGRLPRHETAYAMTVHKSQGSEFDTVLLLLPRKDNPVLSRELIYTGVTRAVSRCEIWAAPQLFHQACERRVTRASGLQKKLYAP